MAIHIWSLSYSPTFYCVIRIKIGLYIIVSHLKITLLIRIYYILWNGPEFYCVIALTEMEILDFQCYVD